MTTFFFFRDRLKNFCEDLFLFFLESTCACVHGPWPWPRAFLSLASRVFVLEKAVLGLGLGFFCVLGLGLEPCVLDSTSAVYKSYSMIRVKVIKIMLSFVSLWFWECGFSALTEIKTKKRETSRS